MEAKSERRHTSDGAAHKHVGSKEMKRNEEYSLEQKFSNFVKESPNSSPDAKAISRERERRVTEGCDVKIPSNSTAASVRKSEDKNSAASDDDDDIADLEFERMMRAPDEGTAAIATDPKARELAMGLEMYVLMVMLIFERLVN